MASYTARQYDDQRRILAVIVAANTLRRCPCCQQPQGTWPDGTARITCGRDACYRKWLHVRPERIEEM